MFKSLLGPYWKVHSKIERMKNTCIEDYNFFCFFHCCFEGLGCGWATMLSAFSFFFECWACITINITKKLLYKMKWFFFSSHHAFELFSGLPFVTLCIIVRRLAIAKNTFSLDVYFMCHWHAPFYLFTLCSQDDAIKCWQIKFYIVQCGEMKCNKHFTVKLCGVMWFFFTFSFVRCCVVQYSRKRY